MQKIEHKNKKISDSEHTKTHQTTQKTHEPELQHEVRDDKPQYILNVSRPSVTDKQVDGLIDRRFTYGGETKK